jgi:hypothetical protein
MSSNFNLLLSLEESCGPDQDYYNWIAADDSEDGPPASEAEETASEAEETASEAEDEPDDEPDAPAAPEPEDPPGEEDVVVLCRGCWAPGPVCATGYCPACLNQMLMD